MFFNAEDHASWDNETVLSIKAQLAATESALSQSTAEIAGLRSAGQALLDICIAQDREEAIFPQQMQQMRQALSTASPRADAMAKVVQEAEVGLEKHGMTLEYVEAVPVAQSVKPEWEGIAMALANYKAAR